MQSSRITGFDADLLQPEEEWEARNTVLSRHLAELVDACTAPGSTSGIEIGCQHGALTEKRGNSKQRQMGRSAVGTNDRCDTCFGPGSSCLPGPSDRPSTRRLLPQAAMPLRSVAKPALDLTCQNGSSETECEGKRRT
jgi:hypothetical protein